MALPLLTPPSVLLSISLTALLMSSSFSSLANAAPDLTPTTAGRKIGPRVERILQIDPGDRSIILADRTLVEAQLWKLQLGDITGPDDKYGSGAVLSVSGGGGAYQPGTEYWSMDKAFFDNLITADTKTGPSSLILTKQATGSGFPVSNSLTMFTNPVHPTDFASGVTFTGACFHGFDPATKGYFVYVPSGLKREGVNVSGANTWLFGLANRDQLGAAVLTSDVRRLTLYDSFRSVPALPSGYQWYQTTLTVTH